MPAPQMQRTVPEVLQDIIGNLQSIISSEFRLAKTELGEQLSVARPPATKFAAGALLAVYGVGFVLLGAMFALSTVMPLWAAALIVGAALSIIAGAILAASTKKLQQLDFSPRKTARSVEEDVQWAKDQIR